MQLTRAAYACKASAAQGLLLPTSQLHKIIKWLPRSHMGLCCSVMRLPSSPRNAVAGSPWDLHQHLSWASEFLSLFCPFHGGLSLYVVLLCAAYTCL